MAAFTQLTDNVIFNIRGTQLSDNPPEDIEEKRRWEDIKEAKDIIERIFRRDLFHCMYESQARVPRDLRKHLGVDDNADIEATVLERIKIETHLTEKDIIIKVNI
ncbi:deoxynucleoside triphosphate triphosphohydrolase SAMHD1 [Biomphalaria pfeifferi]|uniref:Deoxynucleoside triphosphate triphosphohydrolase SAMHD1 n=1 Tax=Biomphalaria pfeifferi TaxID=112525 RepID=A0AAD8BYV0_BIOPF|nr:deoxynucleoside triphosphate triphosphohydrolase SAMHD1 [Biomphalaria pfeifferi]